MRGDRIGVLAGWVLLTAAVMAPDAEACSPMFCQPGTAPSDGAVVPENAPALVINPDQNFGGGVGFDAGTIELLDQSGNPVAFTVEQETGPERFLVRPAQLQSGQQYQLGFGHPCYEPPSDQDAGEAAPKSLPSTSSPFPERYGVTFEAGPSSTLPSTLGTVNVTTSAQVVQAGTYCGSCTAPLAAAVAQLELLPSPELTPFLATTRFKVRVDGAHWAFSEYGDPPEGVPTFAGGPVRSVQTVFASCGTGDTYVYDLGVAPGRHLIEVTAHIAGAAQDPAPVTFEVDLDCSPWNSMERPTEICMYQEQDGGNDRDAGSDGGTDPSGDPPSGGCSGTWFGAAALLGAAVFRRRLG